jgi:serine protease Do
MVDHDGRIVADDVPSRPSVLVSCLLQVTTQREGTPMDAVAELEATIRRVAGDTMPSIVGIGSRLRGSGFVLAEGRLVTNAHNLRGEETTVTFADGTRARGTVLGLDLDADLAVVGVDTGGRPALPWALGPVEVGTAVLAAAAGPEGPRCTLGFVSGVGRSFRSPSGTLVGPAIEHTAPLAPGASGGPLLDREGRVVGIDTHRLGDGFYLAIAAGAELRGRLERLASGDVPRRLRLGVVVAPPEVARRLRRAVGLAEVEGLLVRGVEPGSLAEAAGLREGDVIVGAAGRPIGSVDDLHAVLTQVEPPFEVRIVRGAEETTVTVRSPEQPPE